MSEAERVRVILADDHSVFRRGMRDLLSEDEHVEIIGEAESGEEALEQARRSHPDVVVMDVRMPGMDGISATRAIKAELPETEVVVVSAFEDDQQVLDALHAGASGYLVKDDEPQAMVRAVLNASGGKLYLGPDVAKRVLARLAQHPEQRTKLSTGRSLTARETMVIRLMAQGKRNREIAASLGISERTVGNHIANIFSKLQVQDRAQAIVYAIRNGIIRI